MRRIRMDIAGEEAITGKVVFLAVFITISAVLISQSYYIIADKDGGNWDVKSGYQVVGNFTYTALLPTDGYAISDDNISSYIAPAILDPSGDELRFDPDDITNDDAVRVSIVRSNSLFNPVVGGESIFSYQDFFFIKCEYGGFLGMGDVHIDYLPMSQVLDSQIPGFNVSMTPIHVGTRDYTMMITAPGDAADFEAYILTNSYTINIVLTTEDLQPSGSMWTTIGQVLTMDLPNTHWFVDLVLFTFSWSMIAIIVIEIWARLWPL